MTDLEQAVHALTRETRTKVIQDGDGQQSVAIVTHAPLLTQLAEAVTSAIGSGGGGGTATGSVLNGEALYRVSLIRSAILSWSHMLKVAPVKDLVQSLELWADAFSRTEGEPTFYIRQMEGWAELIKNLLDPPNRLEVTEPCPVCLADEFKDAEGNTLKFPVIIEFRRDRPGEARGLCRSCDEVWQGEQEIRRLRWDIGVKEVG